MVENLDFEKNARYAPIHYLKVNYQKKHLQDLYNNLLIKDIKINKHCSLNYSCFINIHIIIKYNMTFVASYNSKT